MSEERSERGEDGLSAKVESAQRRLREASESAAAAEQRAGAEIRALEARLEKERLGAAERTEALRREHEDDLRREREAKERAIAAAEGRLAEIEAQMEAAEQRIEEQRKTSEQRIEAAERRAAEAERVVADADARAREAAAAWLRGRVEAIRREAGKP